MKKKYYESNFGKKSEDLTKRSKAPKNANDFVYEFIDFEKERREAWERHNQKLKQMDQYFIDNKDKEIKRVLRQVLFSKGSKEITDFAEQNTKSKLDFIQIYCELKGGYNHSYKITVLELYDYIRQINLEKAMQERAEIKMEIGFNNNRAKSRSI